MQAESRSNTDSCEWKCSLTPDKANPNTEITCIIRDITILWTTERIFFQNIHF